MRDWLKDPLLHFMVVGVVLFSAYQWIDGEEPLQDQARARANAIVIDTAQLEHLTALWKLQWKREPSPDDLQAIIERYLRQEVFYREALKLELDHNDEIIKKRLAQKMEVVAEDLSYLTNPPTEQTLRKFFNDNTASFTLPESYAFSQVLVLVEEPEVEQTLANLHQQLQSGAPIPAARKNKLSLPQEWPLLNKQDIHHRFGGEFAESLAKLPEGEWSGPVRSGYGWHLVRIDHKQARQVPEFATVRERVAREFEYQTVLNAQEAMFQDLLKRYQVTILADGVPASIKAEFNRNDI